MLFHLRTARICLITLLLGCWAIAAGPESAPITVKKTDGTSATGEMLSADPESITLLPPGKKDAVVIAWKDVASVSNGLTQKLALGVWKNKHADRLCGTCEGNGTLIHETCEGKGINPETKKDCVPCKGVGGVGKCTNVKCKEGKVDCPGDCLKRSVGKWVQRNGQWYREWQIGKLTSWASEHHLGELFTVGPNGYEPKGNCNICQRTSKVDCSVCEGKKLIPCKPCSGLGITGPACTDCKAGRLVCHDCKGKRLGS